MCVGIYSVMIFLFHVIELELEELEEFEELKELGDLENLRRSEETNTSGTRIWQTCQIDPLNLLKGKHNN